MTPLAHVVQVAIIGGALVGVLVMFGGTAVVDYLNAKARAAAAVVDQGDGIDPEFEEYLDIVDDEVDLPEPDDPGAEWDRARDRDRDYRWGAA